MPSRKVFLYSQTPLPTTGLIPVVPGSLARRQFPEAVGMQQLAQQILEQKGLLEANPLRLHLALVGVLQTAGYPDAHGYARAYAPTLQRLLQQNTLDPSSPERYGHLSQLAIRWAQSLEELNLYHPSRTLYIAAQHSPQPLRIQVVGFPRLGLAELEFIHAVADAGSEVWLPLPNPDLFAENLESASYLAQHGWEVLHQASPQPLLYQSQVCQVHRYSDIHQEVRGVLAQVKQQLDMGVSKDQLALLVRNEALYGPPLRSVAWEYDLPLTTFESLPFEHSQIGGFLQLCLEANQQSFAFESTARLLAHPLAGFFEGLDWPHLRKLGPRGLPTWQQLGVDLQSLVLPAQIGQLEGFLAPLLPKLYDPRELQAARSLQDALHSLLPTEATGQTLEWLPSLLANLSTRPPTQAGIEVHTPLSLLGAKVEHLYVLGAAEGWLPAAAREDPVLPYLEGPPGQETAAQAARRENIAIWGALQAAQRLYFSFPKRHEAKPLQPSRWLAGLEIQAPPNQEPMSPEESWEAELQDPVGYTDGVFERVVRAVAIEQGRYTSEVFGPHEGMVGTPVAAPSYGFSPTQLLMLGQCPFRWFGQMALGLRQEEERGDELDSTSYGSLVHAALEVAVKLALQEGWSTATEQRQAVLAHLEQAWLQAEAKLGAPMTPAWPAYRIHHLQKLREAIEAEGFLLPNALIQNSESKVQGTWQGLLVQGRIDRIDTSPQGLILVDYKTRASAPLGIKDPVGQLKVDLQLPLYQELWQQTSGQLVASAYYYSTSAALPIAMPSPNQEHLAAFAQQVQHRLQQGAFPVSPDVNQEACRYCHLSQVCRVNPMYLIKDESPTPPNSQPSGDSEVRP